MKDIKNNTGENNSGYRNSGDRNSGDWNSGDGNSGDWNSGYGNSGGWNSGDGNSGGRNSGDGNSGGRNSGYGNSGYRNSGDWNSGDGNSGDWNSGIFNTDEPKMRTFNRECDMTYTEFRNKFGYKDIDFPLNEWRDKEDMTDDEKKSVKGWEQMGGYLKTLGYKEAWAAGWAEATQEQKDWYKSLPNFDAAIFEEITGIFLGDEARESDIIEVNGVKYKKV
jgi:PPE-repeat protein